MPIRLTNGLVFFCCLLLAYEVGSQNILAKWTLLTPGLESIALFIPASILTTVIAVLRSLSLQRNSEKAKHSQLVADLKIFDQQRQIENESRFRLALNNMLHGLCMFDAQSRVIVCNDIYARMYDLPLVLTLPGAAYVDIIAYRMRNIGYINLAKTPQPRGDDLTKVETMVTRELADGRVILVRSKPIKEGGWIASHEDITERRKNEDQLSHMARHDALTGLPNRVLLQEQMHRAAEGLNGGKSFAVLCMDLDSFKEINDTLGHSVGDAVLRDFANRLKNSIRSGDTIARIGGDGFAILQAAVNGESDIIEFAQRLLPILNAPCEIEGHHINVGATLGIAWAPRDGNQAELLLRKADTALHRAKSQQRRGYRFFEIDMEKEMTSRRELEIEFRKALVDGNLEVFYQPLLDARSQKITNFEALVRWRHPVRGLIPPIEFIPLAEETGLIVPLGDWVLKTACLEAARWPSDVCVSVNLSAHQFSTADLVGNVRAALTQARLPADRLELEITESALLLESQRTLEILHTLRDMGIKIAMDDFGTGYSSLSYLRSFPFSKIKIDKSFIQNMDQHDARAIVESIAALGKALDMKTTAEGVETAPQLEMVRIKGCDEVQGYLFSKPVPASEIDGLLGKFHGEVKIV